MYRCKFSELKIYLIEKRMKGCVIVCQNLKIYLAKNLVDGK